MKTKTLSFFVIFLFGTINVFAQMKTEEIKVYGTCGMCKTRIEQATKDIEGVSTADWNQKTKMLEVTFDKSKTNILKVHIAVSDVGHDTDLHKADNEVYNNLNGCCKYERPDPKKKTHSYYGIKKQ